MADNLVNETPKGETPKPDTSDIVVQQSGRKRGKFSIEEINFMNTNMHSLSADEIAQQLNRTVEVVQKHLDSLIDDKHETLNRLENKEAFKDLKTKPFWAELKQQYSERELELYLYHWAKFLEQFNWDVTHSEESQICKTIDLEIMMHRNLKEKFKIDGELARLDKELNKALDKDKEIEESELGEKDKGFLLSQHRTYTAAIMAQIQGIRSSQMTRTKEYNELLDKHQKMNRDLKVTRDQRYKDIEDRKKTFIGLLKQFENAKEKQRMSTEAELISLSSKKALNDLGEYHTYIDGTVDQPILNSETLKEDNNG